MTKTKNILKTLMVSAFSALIALPIVTMAADEKKEPAKPVEAAALLSKHETKAVFKGVVFKECMGLTLLCPKDCGHSGGFAEFEITEYTKYEKPGEYGDPQQKTFVIQVSDFDKKPLTKDSNGNDLAATLKIIKSLKAGDAVTLNWNHLYITATYPDGTSSSFPRRVIQKLEKFQKEASPEITK